MKECCCVKVKASLDMFRLCPIDSVVVIVAAVVPVKIFEHWKQKGYIYMLLPTLVYIQNQSD